MECKTDDQFCSLDNHRALFFRVHVVGCIEIVMPRETVADRLFPLTQIVRVGAMVAFLNNAEDGNARARHILWAISVAKGG